MARITHKHTTGQGQREGLGADPLDVPPDPCVHFVTFSCCYSIPTPGPGIPVSALCVGFTATSHSTGHIFLLGSILFPPLMDNIMCSKFLLGVKPD